MNILHRLLSLSTPSNQEREEAKRLTEQEEKIAKLAAILGVSGAAALRLAESTPWTLEEVIRRAAVGDVRPEQDASRNRRTKHKKDVIMQTVLWLNPTQIFASWPPAPTPLYDALGRADALVYVESDDGMGYVAYRVDYGPLGNPGDLRAEMTDHPERFTKERLAWPFEWVQQAEAAGCASFLSDAAWRAANARILWQNGRPGSLIGWFKEEAVRAGELGQVMRKAGVLRVQDLWAPSTGEQGTIGTTRR